MRALEKSRDRLFLFFVELVQLYRLLTRWPSSTVLDLAFVDVQWRQVVTVFPVVEAGQFVAFEAALGHGRAYGVFSQVVWRGLPGIADCGVWRQLSAMESRPACNFISMCHSFFV